MSHYTVLQVTSPDGAWALTRNAASAPHLATRMAGSASHHDLNSGTDGLA